MELISTENAKLSTLKLDLLQRLEMLKKEIIEVKSEYKASCVTIKQLEETLALRAKAKPLPAAVQKDEGSSIKIKELLAQESSRLLEIRGLKDKI